MDSSTPSLSLGVFSSSCPLSQGCYLTISSSASLFSFCFQSFSASGSFLLSWLFASGGQSIGASASVLPVNIQNWFPLSRADSRPPELPPEKPCIQVKKQQLELDMKQQTGSKSGKEYIKAIYCHPVYLTYMHSTSRRRQWYPTPVLLPGESHGWRSLVGCSPWGR